MGDAIICLHGDEHRQRRRLENRLFRRDTFYHYERELFPEIIEETVKPYIADGHVELVSFGHQLMMNLSASTAGVDRPLGTPEETFHLYDYLTTFIEGATLAHYTGDKDAKRAEIQAQLEAFDDEFLGPGIARRQALIEQFDAGEIDEDELPKDVLMVLLRNVDKIPLSRESIRREIAFYLLAGAHTSATAFTRCMHHLFTMARYAPRGRRPRPQRSRLRAEGDPRDDPAAALVSDRHALGARRHRTVVRGRDRHGRPGRHRPHRRQPRQGDLRRRRRRLQSRTRADAEGVAPWGLSFGHGMHACIGQDLAAGLVFEPDETIDDHLFGLVPVAVQTMFDHGCRPDPDNPPEMDDSTTRPYFGKYPATFIG